jgi:hypothetical protein
VVWPLCFAAAKVSLSAKAGKPTLDWPKSSAVIFGRFFVRCYNFCEESVDGAA